jgi:hypothetical protein
MYTEAPPLCALCLVLLCFVCEDLHRSLPKTVVCPSFAIGVHTVHPTIRDREQIKKGLLTVTHTFIQNCSTCSHMYPRPRLRWQLHSLIHHHHHTATNTSVCGGTATSLFTSLEYTLYVTVTLVQCIALHCIALNRIESH